MTANGRPSTNCACVVLVLPRSGKLWLDMKAMKCEVKKQISVCRARKERGDIQRRDSSFKNNSKYRFRVYKQKATCRKLLDKNQHQSTDPSTILNLFRSYFSKLASSSIDASNEKHWKCWTLGEQCRHPNNPLRRSSSGCTEITLRVRIARLSTKSLSTGIACACVNSMQYN